MTAPPDLAALNYAELRAACEAKGERFVPLYGGATAYVIGDHGTVLSLPRYGRQRGPMCLFLSVAGPRRSGGYARVCIHGLMKFVHRLVLFSFVGPPPEGFEASHLNGCKTDNRLCNLAWESKRQNEDRKREHGGVLCGEDTPSAKLTAVQVTEIRSEYRKTTQADLAKRYGVARSTIQRIQSGQYWRSVPAAIDRARGEP